MAESAISSNNKVKNWEAKFFEEYLRDGRFAPYMGEDPFSMIQVKSATKKGDKLSITLINRLTGAGVTGKSTLKGNEEPMKDRTFEFTVDRVRHAVLHDELDEEFSAFNIVQAERAVLKNWIMEKTRDQIIESLGSIAVAGGTAVAYSAASEAQKDAFLVDNADRFLFGALTANNAANDHSAALAQIDNTADKLTGNTLSLAKRLAKTANPRIRPIKVQGDEEWYVLFAGSQSFRDFAADSDVRTANRDAWQRGKDNPLFTGGDLIWDGVIVREVPEISVITGVGAAGINVAPNYLCGAQALGICWKQRTKMIEDVDDYDAKKGAGVQEIRDIKKLLFGKGSADRDDLVQHGVLTLYTAGVAD
jgi:N4-gp56 family major capsid protein